MSMKEIENANTTKANTTRGMCTQYTRHKYTLTNRLNQLQVNEHQQVRGKNE